MCASDTPSAPQALTLDLGGVPLNINVTLTPSDEVLALRQQVADLQHQLSDLRTDYERMSYQYRCETIINLNLTDLCRANKVKIPRRLFQRPYNVPVDAPALPQGDARAPAGAAGM